MILFVSRRGLLATKNGGQTPLAFGLSVFAHFQLRPNQILNVGGEHQNVAAQYSSASMIVMTRSVTDGSVGSGE
jgi:hypothetical protein